MFIKINLKISILTYLIHNLHPTTVNTLLHPESTTLDSQNCPCLWMAVLSTLLGPYRPKPIKAKMPKDSSLLLFCLQSFGNSL